MQIDSFRLNVLPHEQRERFRRYATEIVCESFIFTADRDYLTARFAFFQKQSHLFMWSAAQAIEKYLKANILLLGEGKITRTHHHTKLASTLRKSQADRLNIDLSMPDGWAELGVVLWPSSSVDDFLQRLEVLGSPDVRYDQVQLTIYMQDLVLLDRLAFGLRYRLVSETIQGCRYASKEMKHRFFDLNYSFAPKNHEHPSLMGLIQVHSTSSTLEAALKGCFGCQDLYKEWAEINLNLSPKAIENLLIQSI